MDSINVIKLNNKEIKYLKFGSGSKNIIMIPGLSVKSVIDSSNLIIEAYKIFKDDYTIYLFERIDVPKIYSIKDMAKDIIDSVNYLGLKDLYLLGASQGGMISVCLYLEDKNLVKKIVMASSNFNVDEFAQGIINSWIDLAKDNKKEELVLGFAKYVYPKEVLDNNYDMFINLANSLDDNDLITFISKANALIGFDIRNHINDINIPILIVNDKKDELIKHSEILKNVTNKPNFTYYHYDGYGHALYDLAIGFKELVIDFYNK